MSEVEAAFHVVGHAWRDGLDVASFDLMPMELALLQTLGEQQAADATNTPLSRDHGAHECVELDSPLSLDEGGTSTPWIAGQAPTPPSKRSRASTPASSERKGARRALSLSGGAEGGVDPVRPWEGEGEPLSKRVR